MSGNLYSSTVRRFISSPLNVDTIAPPADYTVAAGSYSSFMYTKGPAIALQPLLNPDSNLIIHNIGLFCNFADGLVFKTPIPFIMQLRAETYNRDAVLPLLTGVVSATAGEQKITGGGTTLFNAELAAGDVIVLNGMPIRIDSVTNDDEAITVEYIPLTVASEPFIQKLAVTGADNSETMFVSTLNDMYPTTSFINPVALYASPSAFIFLRGLFKNDINMDFLTKSVDTAFDGDLVYWTVQADIEFTQEYGD